MKAITWLRLLAWALLTLSGYVSGAPAQKPLFLTTGVSPMVMFAMSVDHQLFTKAFADYSDLNGDGVIDNTYTDSFDYYGYFDSDRCYTYNSSDNYFEPKGDATGAHGHHCTGGSSTGEWSGNFLNWATMTRIDVLRKALYGGKRAVGYDTATQTVLERELLPDDVHAFVKVFTPATGDSMQNYTPFTASTISMCNVTPGPGGNTQTQNVDTSTYHPKVRIASGSWPRWSADEVYQCAWRNNGTSPGTGSNLFTSGSGAPSVRVEACVTGKLGENCQSYNGTDFKPVGLLQEYGEDGTLQFGLTSGSYQNRDKGGVLRKGISYIAGNTSASDDEVNLSDGTFNNAVDGIISSLNKIRLNAWDYTAHKYQDCNTFGISIDTYLTSSSANRKCSNWGNPISELYLEAVRYLIGESSPTSAFNVASDSLNLPTATWDSSSDPMASDEWCTPMNVVVISSGDNSFDTDHLSNVPSVLGAVSAATDKIGTEEGFSGDYFIGEVGASPMTNPDSNICSAKTFTSLSQKRGLCPATPTKQGGYGIAGLAHKARTTDLRSDRDNDPVTGEGQTISTYAIAMAKDLPDFRFKVGSNYVTVVPNAYAGPTGSLPPVVSTDWKASSLAGLTVEETDYDGSGNLTYARFLALWEDSAWGNDYDMDVISRVSVCVGAECTEHDDDNNGSNDSNPGDGVVRVTTRIVHKYAGVSVKVGFVVSGTTNDGEYTTLRYQNGNNFSASDFDNDNAGREPTPTIFTFTPGSSAAGSLPSPLQLAAKYGSFTDSDDNDLPNLQSEWDEDNDGVADSFFFADDPSQIGPKLASFLDTIATTSSASAVVANSASFNSGTRIFQARFDSGDWTGQLLSFPVIPVTGGVQTTPDWDSGEEISNQDYDTGREIITWSPGSGAGVPFRWASLDSAQQTLLNQTTSGGTDTNGERRVNYIRGDDSYEQSNGGLFRDRVSLLGDNVNSSPVFVGALDFNYVDNLEGNSNLYSAFVAQHDDAECYQSDGTTLRPIADLEREPIIFFGANDGMLHGVSACTGEEKLAYVPSALMSGLPELTSPNYSHRYFVDGSPNVVDAFWSGNWHTVLVSSLRAGGKAVFALDVTDPGSFDEANAASLALWEVSASDTDFSELGFTFGQPVIDKVEGHGWVAMFGNGYDSANGKAVLYVVDIDDGDRQLELVLDNGPDNGLSSITPIDSDNDGIADLLYAGDLKGNLWRIESIGALGFGAANSVSKLYAAKTADGSPQPITTQPTVGRHPLSTKGRMVYFGTGKYFEIGDNDPANVVDGDPGDGVEYNSMYAIWDRDNGNTVTSVTTPRNSNTLQRQTITTQTAGTFGTETFDIRILSDTTVTWAAVSGSCGPDSSCGWYLDFDQAADLGEKIVADPVLRGGYLFFVTIVPETSVCSRGGSSWFMVLDTQNGGRADEPVFDLNGDGVFDLNDQYDIDDTAAIVNVSPSGKRSKIGLLTKPAFVDNLGKDGDASDAITSGTDEAEVGDDLVRNVGLERGRKSWLQFK